MGWIQTSRKGVWNSGIGTRSCTGSEPHFNVPTAIPNPRVRNQVLRRLPHAPMARFHAKNIPWRMTWKTNSTLTSGFPADLA